MALIAIVSAKGAPGVTVTSLAFTLSWQRPAIMVECDPSGSSVWAGFLAGQLPSDLCITRLAVADRHGRLYEDFSKHLVGLTRDQDKPKWVLPGVLDPAQAAAVHPMWDRFGAYFRRLEESYPPHDVIADCGRIPALHAPIPLLHHADVVLLMVGRTMDSIVAARSRVQLLRREVEAIGVGALRLLVRGRGSYSVEEISQSLGVEVLAELPEDPKTAEMLSTGSATPRRGSALLRAAVSAQPEIQTLVEQRRAVPVQHPEPAGV